MLNDDFLNALNNLKTELNEHPLVVEYLRYKDLVTKSETLQSLEDELKSLQQLMTQNIANQKRHAEYKEAYVKLKAQYDNHPYIINYNNLVADLNDLLTQLKSILDS